MKTRFLTLALVLGLNGLMNAQDSGKKTSNETKISVEIDPATFGFNGYSLHLRVQPKNTTHLLVGAGIYAMDMPSFLVDLNEKNKNFKVRINQGIGLFAEHYFCEVNRKWFIGTQMGIQEFKIEEKNKTGQEKFTNLLVMGHVGYVFKPFNNNFYLKPWAGIGYTSKISGTNTVNSSEYDIAPVTMFATLHVGYTF